MEIKKVKRILISVFVDGFVCSTGFGAIIDYARTSDSIQFVFGITLVSMGMLGIYLNTQKVDDEDGSV